jgi:hypothetical protein
MTSLYAIMRAYHDAIEQALTDHETALRRLGIDAGDTNIDDDDDMPLAALLTREN